ncbi:MAG: tetratricopeptide repeat protein [Elusimicrobia bacterium]|nr:tetratricopeptide repeat protein [Elusimicrobiota bacterium]
MRILLCLLLNGLIVATGAKADNGAVSADLAWLDKSLTVAQDEKAGGRLSADGYRSFEVKFREQLVAAKAAMEPTTDNITLHARILARLGERGQAVESLRRVLAAEPSNSEVRLALGQVQLEAGEYSAALAEANAVLERDPGNKAALALKHFSSGRSRKGAANETAAVTGPPAAKKSVVVAGAPVKRAAPITVALPDPVSDPVAPNSTPLLPLAGAAGLGALAYGVHKRKTTYESAEGFDEENRPQYGRGQEFVAGAVLAGLAGAAIYLTGSALLSAAPAVTRYVSNAGNQGMRLARSEAGALNSNSKTVNEVPVMLARVIPMTPGSKVPDTIGRIGNQHAFVTAAEDITGLNAQELSQRLGIKPAQQFLVISFRNPQLKIATPVAFDDPQFIGRGLTSGGAREFVLPNGPLPADAVIQVVK